MTIKTTLLVAVALCGCATSLAAQHARVDDAQEITATLIAMWDAIEQGDLDRYSTYLHPDYTAFGESDVYLAVGKDLETRNIQDYLTRATNVHTEMHQPTVMVRGEVAWIVYYWTDAGEIDGERFTSRGKSTRIFVRDNGRWLCIHGHFTAVQ